MASPPTSTKRNPLEQALAYAVFASPHRETEPTRERKQKKKIRDQTQARANEPSPLHIAATVMYEPSVGPHGSTWSSPPRPTKPIWSLRESTGQSRRTPGRGDLAGREELERRRRTAPARPAPRAVAVEVEQTRRRRTRVGRAEEGGQGHHKNEEETQIPIPFPRGKAARGGEAASDEQNGLLPFPRILIPSLRAQSAEGRRSLRGRKKKQRSEPPKRKKTQRKCTNHQA